MSKIVWACWDGGGNLTPSAGRGREMRSFVTPSILLRWHRWLVVHH
jgi:hypothetical protein